MLLRLLRAALLRADAGLFLLLLLLLLLLPLLLLRLLLRHLRPLHLLVQVALNRPDLGFEPAVEGLTEQPGGLARGAGGGRGQGDARSSQVA